MARPERNTVDYFPHFIGSGKKMFFIETKYGNDGYATWFKILEKLSITENHFLNLNEEQDVLFLSSACRIDEKKLFDIISDLVRIGVLNKKCWEKKIIWSDVFIESIQDAYKRRNNKCITFEGLCLHLQSLCITITHENEQIEDSNTQIKVNKSKVNKSKVNEGEFSFENSLIKYGFEEQLVKDWLKVRKNKKATNSETAFKRFISEIEKVSLVPINDLLRICVEKSWSGFEAEWLNNLKSKTNVQGISKTNGEHPLAKLKDAARTILANNSNSNNQSGN